MILRIMIFLKKITNFKIPLLVSLCILTLASAYTIEFFLNIPPCKLCTYQRILYFAVIFLGFTLYFLKKENLFLFLSLSLFLLNLGVSVFHSFVERGLINYSSSCSSNTQNFENINELRNFLENAELVKCDEIIFSILGFSLANINIIILLAFILLSFYLIKHERNR